MSIRYANSSWNLFLIISISKVTYTNYVVLKFSEFISQSIFHIVLFILDRESYEERALIKSIFKNPKDLRDCTQQQT